MESLLKSKITKLLILLIMVMAINPGYSQRSDNHQPLMLPDSTQIVKMVNDMANELSLTEIQKKEITNLHLSHFKEVHILMEKTKAEKIKNKEKMEILKKDFDEQIKVLLTDDQKEKFEKFLETHKPPQRPENEKMH